MLQNGQSAVITLPHRQRAINMPSNGSSTVNTPYHGQSAINMLRDLMISTLGELMIPTWKSASNMLRDLMISTLGDPMIPAGQSALNMMLRALMLPPCHPAPEAQPPLLLHSGPIAHVDVFVDDFIGLAQGSPLLCQHVHHCILACH